MRSLFVYLFILTTSLVHANVAAALIMPMPHLDGSQTCDDGQQSVTDVSGRHVLCFTPDEQDARFGCPDDWILVQSGGEMISCTPKPDHPDPVPLTLPEPRSICGPDQEVYYQLSGPSCGPRYADAGQSCSSALECDGHCLGDTQGQGICAAGLLSFGCTDFLDLNGDVISICID